MNETDVIIAGAGIAGLSLAALLSQRGLRVVVVDGAPHPDRLGPLGAGVNDWDRRVSALTPASSALLTDIGAWAAIVEKRSAAYDSMRVWDAEGTGAVAFTAFEVGAPDLGHIVENRITVDALLGVLEREKTVAVRWNDPIIAVNNHHTAGVQVTTENGDRVTAPLLVGADGAKSIVRRQLGFRVRQWSYEQSAIVATIALEQHHNARCYQAFLATGPLALLPLADPLLCSIVWSLDTSAVDAVRALTDADFVLALNRALGDQAPPVAKVGARAMFPLQQCHAVDYVQPRVALVADAAHAIHPLAGQGINLGLADVGVLADEVEQATSAQVDWGDLAVLRRYQRRRKTENLATMAAMEGFKRGFGSGNPALRVLRNAGLSWVNKSPHIKRWLTMQALS